MTSPPRGAIVGSGLAERDFSVGGTTIDHERCVRPTSNEPRRSKGGHNMAQVRVIPKYLRGSTAPLAGAACALILAASAHADTSCDVGYDAGIKQMQTPHHIVTSRSARGGKVGTDSKLRVSRTNGLLLRRTITLPDGSSIVSRYDDANVEAPPGAR